MYPSTFGYTQSYNDDQRDQEKLIEQVRRVGKVPLLSIKLTKDIVARSILFISFQVTKIGKHGAKQSIKSN